jgi:DNA-binding NtrC family response regulator
MDLLFVDPENAQQRSDFARAAVPRAKIDFVESVYEAGERLSAAAYHACALWLPLPDWSFEDAVEELQRASGAPIVLLEANESVDTAVKATKLGAFYYLGGAFSPEKLGRVLEAAVEHRRSRELALFGQSLLNEPWRKFLVGESQPMQNLAKIIRLIGPRRCTVLITGETGTGKEMIARAIHMASNRSHLPMVAVNCHALPESLLEAELFGHVKGAFTGASAQRIGRFEQAHRSTVFLDEIGDMPLELQAKLLRVLQEREFQRVGSSETVQVDVRVIAAANVSLPDRVREGKFREDLYYRLNVVPVIAPPLRERRSDIPLLVEHFLEKTARQEDMPPKRVHPETVDRLRRYDWPGNVRQLENAVEMANALSGDRPILYPSDFPLPAPSESRVRPTALRTSVPLPPDGIDFDEIVSSLERSLLEQALQRTRGNKKLAAELLRLKRTTLTAKLKSLELTSC